MKRPVLQNKRVRVLQMAFGAPKRFRNFRETSPQGLAEKTGCKGVCYFVQA